MAEGNEVSNEDTEIHIQNLADLWRICGNRLKKNQAKLPDNIHLQGLQRIFEKYFQINPEKDDFAIHPPRFCNLCFATHTRDHVLLGNPHRTAVLVQERRTIIRLGGGKPKNINGEGENIPQRIWMILVRALLVVQKQYTVFRQY